ncbi:DUF6159 family protein [Candidatus Poriferisodalis sp.]|uniref:DUF6159 family protein n=1 Tax=Candidatus Poriferisodalis sp. TaxID=3101277 RepID=UPI003B5A92B4
MGIFGELKSTWSRTRILASTSYGVLKRDRFLMAFPALSLAVVATISVVVWAVVWVTTSGLSSSTVADPGKWATEPTVWIVLVGSVLLCTFASVFFTAALTYGAWERFQGRAPTFESCILAAKARLHVIVPWAILAGFVGVVFEVLYRLPRIFRHMEQAGRHIPVVGHFVAIGAMIVAFVLESIWYFVTYLVVPVLVVEETGPIASCKRSFGLFRKTWGKSLIARVGFELIGLLILLPGLVLATLVVLIGLGSPVALILGIGIGVAWLLAMIVAMSAIVGVFKMALYLYVTTGEVPGEFQGTGLENAFTNKKALKAERKARKARGKVQMRPRQDSNLQPAG